MPLFTSSFYQIFSDSSNHQTTKKSRIWMAALLLLFLSACQPSTTPTIQASNPPLPTPSSTVKNTHIPSPSASAMPTMMPTETPSPKLTAEGNGHVTLMAVGDIMLGRTIGELIESTGPEAPFTDTGPTLLSADITVGNLECPISDRGTAEEKTYVFRAPPTAGESLAFSGFDVLSLANNHALDYGPLALEDTLNILTGHNISPVGAGMNATQAYSPVIMEVNGLRIAFLAYADVPPTDYDYLAWEAGPNKPGISWAHPEKVRSGVASARKQADIVVVLLHNGYEIVQRVSGHQQEIARLAIDSGASLVIGHHPHVLQRIETYKEGLIAYSMGNFVFDNFLFPPNYSAILKVELSSQGVEGYELIDVIVQLNGVPQIMPYDLEN